MEDWEQFFVEKSARRADKDRRERRRRKLEAAIATFAIGATLIGGIIALALTRP